MFFRCIIVGEPVSANKVPKGAIAMIKLTRLGGEAFILNADLIRYVEERPDTFITLTTGERLVVTERMDIVVERAVRYQQEKHLIPAPLALSQEGQSRA
ncbi:MAG: flagellar protein FlbD [Pirellulaceae bacterium]|jgi:flagellar protein FlbD